MWAFLGRFMQTVEGYVAPIRLAHCSSIFFARVALQISNFLSSHPGPLARCVACHIVPARAGRSHPIVEAADGATKVYTTLVFSEFPRTSVHWPRDLPARPCAGTGSALVLHGASKPAGGPWDCHAEGRQGVAERGASAILVSPPSRVKCWGILE